jgi:DNA-binding transcriptional MocR family regulator
MSLLPEASVISFARGIPSPDMFPLEQLAESAKRAVENHGRVALNLKTIASASNLVTRSGAQTLTRRTHRS